MKSNRLEAGGWSQDCKRAQILPTSEALAGSSPQEEPVVAERLVERKQHETALRRADLAAPVACEELSLLDGRDVREAGLHAKFVRRRDGMTVEDLDPLGPCEGGLAQERSDACEARHRV